MKRILLLTTTALVSTAGAAHAGPVVGAIAAVFGGGALAVAAAQVVFGLGLQIVAGAVMRKFAKTPEVSVNFDVQVGDTQPLSFVVGDYVTSGCQTFHIKDLDVKCKSLMLMN